MPPTAVDFNHLREILLARRTSILEQLHREKSTEALAGTRGPVDSAEHAADSYDQDLLAYITDVRSKELADIDTALEKIDDRNYGLCVECGKAIAPKRLRAMPSASLCIQCQEVHDAGYADTAAWGKRLTKITEGDLASIFEA